MEAHFAACDVGLHRCHAPLNLQGLTRTDRRYAIQVMQGTIAMFCYQEFVLSGFQDSPFPSHGDRKQNLTIPVIQEFALKQSGVLYVQGDRYLLYR